MILLLGGTGVIGSYLAERFNSDKIETYITSRTYRKDYGCIHYVQGNAMDDSFLEQICSQKKWDAIVDFMSYKTQKFESRLSILLNSTKQYVFISSARVYGNEEQPIKESSPRLLDCSKDNEFLKTDEYALTKARQENLLINSGMTNYTIVRPCITYGPERLQLGVLEKEEWLYRAIHGRTIVFCDEIASKFTTMTIGLDLCELLIKVINNTKAIGEIYHLTNNYHRKWSDIFKIYAKTYQDITGKKLIIKNVDLNSFLGCRNPSLKYQVIYDRVYDRVYDTSKEESLMTIDQFTAPEDGLQRCLSQFILEQHHFKNINWVNEAKKDRLTNEFASLAEINGLRNVLKYLIYRFIK